VQPPRRGGTGIGDNVNSEHHDASRPGKAPRDWRRIHHSPVFWIGIVLCLAAIAIYVLSDDLSWPMAR
jgi:hypothetical protein